MPYAVGYVPPHIGAILVGEGVNESLPVGKAVAPPCVRCGLATFAMCRVCMANCCGNCVLTPQHEATHEV